MNYRRNGRARCPHRADYGTDAKMWPGVLQLTIGSWNLVFLWSLVLGAWIFLPMPSSAQPTLKDAFANTFRVGAALNPSHFLEQNTNAVAIIKSQFNTITPEN